MSGDESFLARWSRRKRNVVAQADVEKGNVGMSQTAATKDVSGIESEIEVYQLTDTGIVAQASVSGTKYWPDDDLN